MTLTIVDETTGTADSLCNTPGLDSSSDIGHIRQSTRRRLDQDEKRKTMDPTAALTGSGSSQDGGAPQEDSILQEEPRIQVIFCFCYIHTYTYNRLRTQQLVWQSAIHSQSSEKGVPPPACLQDLLAVLRSWHGSETVFICKVLTSESSCPQQAIHWDCVDAHQNHLLRRKEGKQTTLLRTDYSILVSTERGRKNYSVRNRRLFIAVTSISSAHKLVYVEQVVHS